MFKRILMIMSIAFNLFFLILSKTGFAIPYYYVFTTVSNANSENIDYIYSKPLNYIVEIDFDKDAYYLWSDDFLSYWNDGTSVSPWGYVEKDYFYVNLLTPQQVFLNENYYSGQIVVDIHKGVVSEATDTNPFDGVDYNGGSVVLDFGSSNDRVTIEQRSEWHDFIVNGEVYNYPTYDMLVGSIFSISDYAYSNTGERKLVRFWAELTNISETDPIISPVPEPATVLSLGIGLIVLVGASTPKRKIRR